MPSDNQNNQTPPNPSDNNGFKVSVTEEPTPVVPFQPTPAPVVMESGLPQPVFQDPNILTASDMNSAINNNPKTTADPGGFAVTPQMPNVPVVENSPSTYDDLYSRLLSENEKAQASSNIAPTEPLNSQMPPQPEARVTAPVYTPYDQPAQSMPAENTPPVTPPVPIITETPTANDEKADIPTENEPSVKRGFPKYLLFLLVGILVIVALIFLIKNLLGGKKASSEITLTWWGLWEEEAVIKPLIDEYQTKNPGVKINYFRNSPQDYRERLSNSISKGTGPDIFMFHNSWTPIFAKDLSPIPSSVMSGSDILSTYYPVIANDMSKNTSFYGIPFGYDALTLFINDDIFAQEGLEPPQTWIEMREMAPKLLRRENGKIVRAPVAIGRTENVDHWQEILGLMLIQNRVNLKNPEGKKLEDALKFFVILSSTDGYWDETLPPSTQMFANGKLAMYFAPSWRALNIRQLNPDLKFKTVPVPQLPKNDPGEEDIGYATYWANGVWIKSKNSKAAWDFMKFVSTKEVSEKIYKNQVDRRGMGVAYARTDMKDLLKSDPILGSIISLAPNSQSWYLQSRTFDGDTGINSQISKYFEDAINALNQGRSVEEAIKPLNQGVVQVLKQYNLVN